MLKLLETREIDRAINFFHFPPSLSESELEYDRSVLSKSLATIQDAIGVPEKYAEVEFSDSFIEVGVFGGTIPYWAEQPNSGIDKQLLYRVEFDRTGDGIVNLALFHDKDRWQVRSIGFGAKEDTKTGREIVRVRKRIVDLIESEQAQ